MRFSDRGGIQPSHRCWCAGRAAALAHWLQRSGARSQGPRVRHARALLKRSAPYRRRRAIVGRVRAYSPEPKTVEQELQEHGQEADKERQERSLLRPQVASGSIRQSRSDVTPLTVPAAAAAQQPPPQQQKQQQKEHQQQQKELYSRRSSTAEGEETRSETNISFLASTEVPSPSLHRRLLATEQRPAPGGLNSGCGRGSARQPKLVSAQAAAAVGAVYRPVSLHSRPSSGSGQSARGVP